LTGIANDGFVSLSWFEPIPHPLQPNLIGYRVYRDNIAVSDIIESLSFEDHTVTNYTTYYFHVVAIYKDPDRASDPSNKIVLTPHIPVFNPPLNLRAAQEIVPPGIYAIVLNWEEPEVSSGTVTGYWVYRSTAEEGPFERVSPGIIRNTTFTDRRAEPETDYWYYVVAAFNNVDGVSAASNIANATILSDIDNVDVPQLTQLIGNFPNPFNPETTIKFSVGHELAFTHALINIFNTRGQLIRTLVLGAIEPGIHYVVWDGRDEAGRPVSSGIYFYRMETTNFSQTRRMVLLR
jgi:hypothetical protein